jgi:hypothetical protein
MRKEPVLVSIAVALTLSLAGARATQAEAVDDATRSAARALGEQGIALYEAGDYPGALAAFERAEALVQVPTLSLRAARCLEKLGRWVEASERYLTTTALTVSPSLPEAYQEAQRQAQAEAAEARAALTPRIPLLEIVVEGPPPDDLRLDGRVVPTAALGLKAPGGSGRPRAAGHTGHRCCGEEGHSRGRGVHACLPLAAGRARRAERSTRSGSPDDGHVAHRRMGGRRDRVRRPRSWVRHLGGRPVEAERPRSGVPRRSVPVRGAGRTRPERSRALRRDADHLDPVLRRGRCASRRGGRRAVGPSERARVRAARSGLAPRGPDRSGDRRPFLRCSRVRVSSS